MIVAANDVSDRHVHVVHDNREVIGRATVAARDDEIVKLRIFDHDPALDVIGETDRSLSRVAKAHHHRCLAVRSQTQLPAAAVVTRFLLRRHLCRAQFVEPLFRAAAVVGVTLFQQLLDDLQITIEALRLVKRSLVVVEPEPLHAVENRLHRFGRGPLEIGIFYSQHEASAGLAAEQPAKQRGTGSANVQHAGRTGGESCPDHRLSGTFGKRGILTDKPARVDFFRVLCGSWRRAAARRSRFSICCVSRAPCPPAPAGCDAKRNYPATRRPAGYRESQGHRLRAA